jgi:Fe2+ transport system protein FeoA
MISTAEIKLNELSPQQCGVVHRIEAPDDDLERLMAMGVCSGRIVELVQRGDPLILKVYGIRIGVSARLASRIKVHPCSVDSCQSK